MHPPFYNQIQLLIVGFMFLMFLTSVVKPAHALFGYMILMIFRPMNVYPFLGAMRIELIICLCIAVLILVKQRTAFASPNYHPINKALIIFFSIAFLSVIQAFSISHSWDFFYNHYFNMLVFFIMIVCLSDDVKDVKWLIYAYLVMVAWLTYLPIFNHITGFGKMRGDVLQSVGETFGVHSHVAQANLMSQTISFAYFMFFGEKNKIIKAVLIFFIVLYVVAIVVSGSRGGFLGLVILAGIFFYKAKRKLLSVVVLVCLVVVTMGLNPSYLNWMSTILEFGGGDISAHSRIDGLRNGIEMCIRRPILGVGVGCFSLARKEWFGWGIWAHNLYGEVFGEVGLVGAASWFFLIYLCFKEIKKIRHFVDQNPMANQIYKYIADACWATLIVRLLLGMTTHCMYVYIWYFIASILIVTSKSLEKEFPNFALKKQSA